jgi:hypothetical protein
MNGILVEKEESVVVTVQEVNVQETSAVPGSTILSLNF